MTREHLRPTQRFSDRVADYVKYRPSYPIEMIEFMKQELGLSAEKVIVDVGSGTGISAKLFLDQNCKVYGVEPNPDMRKAAEAYLAHYSNFVSVEGQSEKTGLPDQCADFIVAGQAFHGLNPIRPRRNFSGSENRKLGLCSSGMIEKWIQSSKRLTTSL